MSTATKKIYQKRHDLDMTQGSVIKHIISFAFPLMIGNLFQQLYNMVDIWVIGKTGLNGAYAAVGSVNPIINILIGFFLGLSSGTGVIISQYYGAKNEKKANEVVHTAIAMTLIMGVIFTIIGVAMSPVMLKIMLKDSGNEVFAYANTYLTIYFSGVLGVMLYNITAGILRAVGDSKRPFYFLLVSSLTNIVLDLVLVFVFGMDVDGVAVATVVSQWLSAILGVITLFKETNCVKLVINKIKIDRELLKKIVILGIPAGIQLSITAFSNVFVQSYVAGVNANTTYCLAAYTSYSKVDNLLFLPTQAIALAVTTLVGQNMGNKNEKRARQGTYKAIGLSLAVTAFFIVIIELFSKPLAAIFNNDPNVVKYASMLLIYISPFYILTSINQIMAASLRGMGNTKAPMIILLGSLVGIRQIYLFIMSRISNELLPIAFSYPVGWLICSITFLIYFNNYRPTSKIVES